MHAGQLRADKEKGIREARTRLKDPEAAKQAEADILSSSDYFVLAAQTAMASLLLVRFASDLLNSSFPTGSTPDPLLCGRSIVVQLEWLHTSEVAHSSLCIVGGASMTWDHPHLQSALRPNTLPKYSAQPPACVPLQAFLPAETALGLMTSSGCRISTAWRGPVQPWHSSGLTCTGARIQCGCQAGQGTHLPVGGPATRPKDSPGGRQGHLDNGACQEAPRRPAVLLKHFWVFQPCSGQLRHSFSSQRLCVCQSQIAAYGTDMCS